MRKVKLLTTILLVGAIGLSGCEQSPTNTVDENESQESGENQEPDITESEKYVSFAEAQEQINQLKGSTVGGFTFSKNFEMPEIDSISSVKLKQCSLENLTSVEQTLSNIWDDYNSVDWSKIEERKFTHPDYENYLGISKEDTATGYWYSCDTWGFLCGNSIDDAQYGMSVRVKEYDFRTDKDFEEAKNDEYMLKDGKITVGDAVVYVEEKLNKYMVSVENNAFKYKVKKLNVMYDDSTGTYDLNMVIGRVYNGIDVATVSDFTPGAGRCYESIHCGTNILITMRNVNKIDYINNGNESLVIDGVETKESIISPFWAVEEMEKQIANIGGASYGYCGLVYIITQDNQKYGSNGQALYSRADDSSTYLKPYWIFSKKLSSGTYVSANGDVLGETVLVDAIDGTLYFYQMTGGY